MARYIYQWKPTQYGNRLFRQPGTGAAPVRVKAVKATAAPEPDLATLKKDELIELAEERGLDTSGNKPDIIERLEADDEQG